MPVEHAKNLTHMFDIIMREHGTYLVMKCVDLNIDGLASDFIRY